ncbi:hypothetical protein PISMIDRAFT_23587 [Pisolithus microcarpus 441]|uniref:Uncharacterized protein n=1 Tax=Pisolithus microcarpus 441 TaxID=765257 RepID=A0A0C9ZKA1_9AGAM|nr:hypothetical protein PISMIDRAFT_23587 [Pisolithus microcarpus 441]
MQCDDNATDKNNDSSVVENKEESTKENDKEIALVKAQDTHPWDPVLLRNWQQSVLAMCKKAKKSTKSKAQGRQDKVQMEVQGNAEAVPSTSKLIVSKSYKKCGLEPDAEEEVTGEMASNTAGASEMQEPVLVVNKVREMAVVRQENEQEASGPKVKAKARETEASLACHLQSEDDMEEQGAQVQPSRRQSLFPRGDNLIPNIKVTESTEADELGFAVETAIADVTLGYALMTVIHDQAEQRSEEEHWGSGPPMQTPMEVKILGLTVDAAEKEEKDVEKQCQKVAHAMMAEARASTYSAWGLVDELAEKSLVIQADVMKSSKHDHPWHLWGLKDKASRELWNNLLDNEGMSMGHEIQLNKDTSPDDIIQVAFKNKLECSKHARDQDQSMARREPVPVVNKVREMAVVQKTGDQLLIALQQENEQEASGPKVKAKARETEQSEDDMEEQGAQAQPRRRQSLFPRGDNLIPNIKVTESTEADEPGFAVETAIADVTLGYALMTVIHDQAEQRCDLS